VTPFVKQEIPVGQPITFFGHKDLPDKEVDAVAKYKEYNETMERLEEGMAKEKERRADAAAALVAKD